MDNLEEMDKFLEGYNLPRVNQEQIENMNGPVISNEIESVILIIIRKKKTPNKQTSRTRCLHR